MSTSRHSVLYWLVGGVAFLMTVKGAMFGDASGTAEDPIIDSKVTEEEAFCGVDQNCPGDILERQKVIDLLYHGFDGKVHKGQLIIDRELEKDIREIFGIALKLQYPVSSVIPISHPKFRKDGRWDDELSMAANNTSAFNYRRIEGTSKLSQHAYGRAIDLNPLQNPLIRGQLVRPRGAKYDLTASETLTPDHPIVKAFIRRGWDWGGNWKSLKDFQHFEKPEHLSQ